MKTRITLIYCLLFSILLSNCSRDQDTFYESDFGSVLVSVVDYSYPVMNAVVSTIPHTQIYQTDESGTVLIKDIDPGEYTLYTYHPSYGSGLSTVVAKQGEVVGEEMTFTSSVIENPIITFVYPETGQLIDLGTTLEMSVQVYDNSDLPDEIQLEWWSSIDGLLSNQSANPSGNAKLSLNSLSEGVHNIQVVGTDSDGFVGGAAITVTVSQLPNTVVLNLLQGNASGIELNWSKSDEPEFSKYQVYRSKFDDTNFQIIEIIDDINTTSFLDNTTTVGVTYYYKIGVLLKNGDEGTSNIQFVNFQGTTISVGTQIERMIVDPERPYIYAVDRVNNQLLFINTDGNVLVKTIDVGLSPTDLDISIDGDRLYIANFGSSQINVIDLETQEIEFNFDVDPNTGTWDGNPYRLTVLANNRLAYVSQDQWCEVKIVNATTGAFIDYSSSIYRPSLFSNSDGTILYAGESGSSGSQVIRFDLTGNSLSEVDESISVSASRPTIMSANDQFIFFSRRKLLANNLQSVLGSFPETIHATNHDGSIVLGEDDYYNGNTFTTLGQLPVSSTTMASDPNSDTFYIYDIVSSSIVVFTP